MEVSLCAHGLKGGVMENQNGLVLEGILPSEILSTLSAALGWLSSLLRQPFCHVDTKLLKLNNPHGLSLSVRSL